MKNNTKTAVINISKKRIEGKNFQLKVSSAKRNKVKDIFFPAVCFFQVYHRSLRVIFGFFEVRSFASWTLVSEHTNLGFIQRLPDIILGYYNFEAIINVP